MNDETIPGSREGSLKYQPTEEQAHQSALLTGCARVGFTETQVIEMLWRQNQALMRETAKLLGISPRPVRFIVSSGEFEYADDRSRR
jgi:hypothetical protein